MAAKFTCQFTLAEDPDAPSYGELAAGTLRAVAPLVEDGRSGGVIRDVNGNKIGSWKLR